MTEYFVEGFVIDIDEAGDELVGVLVGVGGADNDNDDDRSVVSEVDVAALRYDFDDVMVIGFDVEFSGVFDNLLDNGMDDGWGELIVGLVAGEKLSISFDWDYGTFTYLNTITYHDIYNYKLLGKEPYKEIHPTHKCLHKCIHK